MQDDTYFLHIEYNLFNFVMKYLNKLLYNKKYYYLSSIIKKCDSFNSKK